MTWRAFPDIQELLKTALESDPAGPMLGTGHVGIITPDNLADVLPYVRVRRGGGGSTRVFDQPTVDIDAFAGTYAVAYLLAEQIRQWLVGPPCPIALIDHATCDGGPQELPWPTARRMGLTFHVETRRRITVH